MWARIHPDLEPLLWKDGPVRIDYGFEISEISREDSEIPIRDVILPEDRYTKINGVRVLPETIRIIEKLPPPPRPLSVWRRLLRWIGTVRKIDQ